MIIRQKTSQLGRKIYSFKKLLLDTYSTAKSPASAILKTFEKSHLFFQKKLYLLTHLTISVHFMAYLLQFGDKTSSDSEKDTNVKSDIIKWQKRGKGKKQAPPSV